jgi:hypothetical protein
MLAALGGFLIILGGIVGLLFRWGAYAGDAPAYVTTYIVVVAELAVLFGVIILVFSGFTASRGLEQNPTGGIVLLVLGIVTWAIVGGWFLVVIGSLLTVMSGLVLILLVVLHEPHIRVQTT